MAEIEVRSKISGRIGTLPEDRFDPAKYERVGANATPSAQLSAPTMTQPEQPQETRVAGGLIPTATSMISGLAAAPLNLLGPPGRALAAGAAGAGTLPGFAIESGLAGILNSTSLGKGKKYQERVSPGDILKEAGFQAAGELGGGIIGDFLSKGLPALGKQLIKTALPEKAEKATTGFASEVFGGGKQLSSFISDEGIKGTTKTLAKIAKAGREEVSKAIDGFVENLNKTILTPVTDIVSPGIQGGTEKRGFTILNEETLKEPLNQAQTYIKEVLDQVPDYLKKKGNIKKDSSLKQISEELQDIWKYYKKAGSSDGWQAVVDLQKAENQAGNIIAGEADAVTKKIESAIQDLSREKMKKVFPELAELFNRSGMFQRLEEAATRKGGKALISPETIGRLLLTVGAGGAGYSQGGLPGAAAGITAAQLPFSPAAMTHAAQGLNIAGQVAGKTLPPIIQGVTGVLNNQQ